MKKKRRPPGKGTANRKIMGRRTRATTAPSAARTTSTHPYPAKTRPHSRGAMRAKFSIRRPPPCTCDTVPPRQSDGKPTLPRGTTGGGDVPGRNCSISMPCVGLNGLPVVTALYESVGRRPMTRPRASPPATFVRIGVGGLPPPVRAP
jgi:hypothetical protein